MLKYVLLAGSMLIAVPALAQTAPATPNTPAPPQTTPAVPATPAPVTPPAADPAAPPVDAAPPASAQTTPLAPTPAVPAAPAPNAQAATPAPADPATAAATPAPAPAGPQVADVVGKEFPVYDKNGNGSLSKGEFSTWMLALKKTSDPAVKDDAANKSWTTQAFVQADTDKSKSVSKDELTNFLAQGQTTAS
jgi:hypothetical protein